MCKIYTFHTKLILFKSREYLLVVTVIKTHLPF